MPDTGRTPLVDNASTTLLEKVLLWTFPIAFLGLVIGILSFVSYYGWTEAAHELVARVEDKSDMTTQAVILTVAHIVLAVCCMPGPSFVMILTGFIFKFWVGWMLNLGAEIAGLLFAVLIGRTCFRGRVRRLITQNKMLKEAVDVCEQDPSALFLVLFRFLSVPVWVKNYTMAELEISVSWCVMATLPAATYYSCVFTYVGSKSFDTAQLLRDGKTPYLFSFWEVLFLGVSFVALALIIYMGSREFQRRREAMGAISSPPADES